MTESSMAPLEDIVSMDRNQTETEGVIGAIQSAVEDAISNYDQAFDQVDKGRVEFEKLDPENETGLNIRIVAKHVYANREFWAGTRKRGQYSSTTMIGPDTYSGKLITPSPDQVMKQLAQELDVSTPWIIEAVSQAILQSPENDRIDEFNRGLIFAQPEGRPEGRDQKPPTKLEPIKKHREEIIGALNRAAEAVKRDSWDSNTRSYRKEKPETKEHIYITNTSKQPHAIWYLLANDEGFRSAVVTSVKEVLGTAQETAQATRAASAEAVIHVTLGLLRDGAFEVQTDELARITGMTEGEVETFLGSLIQEIQNAQKMKEDNAFDCVVRALRAGRPERIEELLVEYGVDRAKASEVSNALKEHWRVRRYGDKYGTGLTVDAFGLDPATYTSYRLMELAMQSRGLPWSQEGREKFAQLPKTEARQAVLQTGLEIYIRNLQKSIHDPDIRIYEALGMESNDEMEDLLQEVYQRTDKEDIDEWHYRTSQILKAKLENVIKTLRGIPDTVSIEAILPESRSVIQERSQERRRRSRSEREAQARELRTEILIALTRENRSAIFDQILEQLIENQEIVEDTEETSLNQSNLESIWKDAEIFSTQESTTDEDAGAEVQYRVAQIDQNRFAVMVRTDYTKVVGQKGQRIEYLIPYTTSREDIAEWLLMHRDYWPET